MIDLIRETQIRKHMFLKKIIELKISFGLSLGSVLMTRVLELDPSSDVDSTTSHLCDLDF